MGRKHKLPSRLRHRVDDRLARQRKSGAGPASANSTPAQTPQANSEPVSDKAGDFILNPILNIVEHSLGEVLAGVRTPKLPVRSPAEWRELGCGEDFNDGDAYIMNTLPAVVWGKCMIGLDFMQGLRRTVAGGTYLSAYALARAALESFAFAFWVCDDRLAPDERYRRALLLNRETVQQERRRRRRDWDLSKPGKPYEFEAGFADRLGLIDEGIALFGEQLDQDGPTYATKVPSKTQAVKNILVDVAPTPAVDVLYGKLSDVVHADDIFIWDLLSPHPDGFKDHISNSNVLLSTSISTHLIPVWSAAVAMCIALGVARSVIEIERDMDAMREFCKDLQGFVVHNGEELIWRRGDTTMTDDQMHALDWYLQKKGNPLIAEAQRHAPG